MSTTTIAGKAVLVTGANRGLGQALVAEALEYCVVSTDDSPVGCRDTLARLCAGPLVKVASGWLRRGAERPVLW